LDEDDNDVHLEVMSLRECFVELVPEGEHEADHDDPLKRVVTANTSSRSSSHEEEEEGANSEKSDDFFGAARRDSTNPGILEASPSFTANKNEKPK